MKKRWSVLLALTLVLLLGLCMSGCEDDSAAVFRQPDSGRLPAGASATSPQIITREQARQIALERSGLTEQQVTGLQIEYEFDDGIPHYEVQFRQGFREYEYTIHAVDGKILDFDTDN